MFNKFFDCLNTRSTKEYIKKRKSDVSPYESRGDERLKVSETCCTSCYQTYFIQWLKDEFLPYLNNWKKEAAARSDLPPKDRQRLCLSRETLEGLQMTSKVV